MERVVAARAGKAPILRSDLEKAEGIAKAVAEQIGSIEGCEGFHSATPELVAVSRDPLGPWLRVMIDKFEDHGDHAVIWDLKTGEQSAAPMGLGRRIANMGMEVQAALYERVVINLRPELAGRIRFRWLFIENDAPHSLIPAELDNVGMEIGRRKVAAAIHRRSSRRNTRPTSRPHGNTARPKIRPSQASPMDARARSSADLSR
jgi:hypothetical protein